MKVNVETLEKSTAKMTVEIPAADFDEAITKAYNKQKNRFDIPGFRKGHAPQSMVEKMYGPGIFYETAVDILLDETYPDAVKESKLDIVSRPEIDIVKVEKGQEFVYTAVVAVRPEVKLGKYKGVKVEKSAVSVSAKEVEEELNASREKNARLVAIEDEKRKIKKDDIATIDFTGYVNDKEFSGGKGENYPLTIGSHSFIDTFEDQLIGHKKGEDVDVNVTFPENYQAKDLAGKPALFKVSIKEIKEKQLPELDDEFASEVSEFDTLKEYKASLKETIKERKQKMADQEFENKVLDKVVSDAKVEIPDGMIALTQENLLNDYEQRLMMQGMKLEQYLGYMQMTKEQFKESLKPEAENSTKTRLVLDAIVKAEKITVSDERVEEDLKKMADGYKMTMDQIKGMMREGDLEAMKDDMACQDAIRFIIDNADAKEKKAETKEKAEKKDADKKETVKKETKASSKKATEKKAKDKE